MAHHLSENQKGERKQENLTVVEFLPKKRKKSKGERGNPRKGRRLKTFLHKWKEEWRKTRKGFGSEEIILFCTKVS